MSKVAKIAVLDGFRLEVTFADGVHGVVDMTEQLHGPVFEPLKNKHFFGQARIDAYGVICWPNGADLAPDALYADLVALSAS